MKRFNLYRKYFNRIMGVLGALLIFCMIYNTLNYIYVKDEDWTRILWHNFYKNNGKIDNIYLGSSHVYYDIDPMMLDDMNGQFNFNLSSPALRLNGAYYLLKEADKYNKLSHVYLEVYYKQYVTIPDFEIDVIDVSHHWNYENTDYMKNSFNKLGYMLSIAEPEKYIDIFLPFSRYRTKLDNWEYIGQTIGPKNDFAYHLYEHHSESERGKIDYMPQGYQCNTEELEDAERMYQQVNILEYDLLGEKVKNTCAKLLFIVRNVIFQLLCLHHQ